uniref:Uncharacterized protein n=1 Tax=Arundo donax TaxID=35708 RepID=A0A0A8Z2K2_ARUDO
MHMTVLLTTKAYPKFPIEHEKSVGICIVKLSLDLTATLYVYILF